MGASCRRERQLCRPLYKWELCGPTARSPSIQYYVQTPRPECCTKPSRRGAGLPDSSSAACLSALYPTKIHPATDRRRVANREAWCGSASDLAAREKAERLPTSIHGSALRRKLPSPPSRIRPFRDIVHRGTTSVGIAAMFGPPSGAENDASDLPYATSKRTIRAIQTGSAGNRVRAIWAANSLNNRSGLGMWRLPRCTRERSRVRKRQFGMTSTRRPSRMSSG